MKTKFLKHGFFYFFILLGLIVSFNGCSDDDDITSQIFLEKLDGTKWVYTELVDDNEFSIYIRINNNIYCFKLIIPSNYFFVR